MGSTTARPDRRRLTRGGIGAYGVESGRRRYRLLGVDPANDRNGGLVDWGWLVLGFLAFSLVCVMALWLVGRVTRVTPTVVSTPAELQEILRALYSAGHDGEILFIVWFPSRFEVRVTKRSPESKHPTLALEVQNSENNRAYYAQARAVLDREGLEFFENLTPGQERAEGLKLLWPDGGPFVVSAAANAIGVLATALPGSTASRCAASCQLPSMWRTTDTRAA